MCAGATVSRRRRWGSSSSSTTADARICDHRNPHKTRGADVAAPGRSGPHRWQRATRPRRRRCRAGGRRGARRRRRRTPARSGQHRKSTSTRCRSPEAASGSYTKRLPDPCRTSYRLHVLAGTRIRARHDVSRSLAGTKLATSAPHRLAKSGQPPGASGVPSMSTPGLRTINGSSSPVSVVIQQPIAAACKNPARPCQHEPSAPRGAQAACAPPQCCATTASSCHPFINVISLHEALFQ